MSQDNRKKGFRRRSRIRNDRESFPRHREKISYEFAEARDLVQKRKTAKAMRLLDRLAKREKQNPRRIAKIASLVGDSEAKHGRFESAVKYYRQARQALPEEDRRDWFRPYLAEIRCLIRAVRSEEAFHCAEQCWEKALERQQEFEADHPVSPAYLKRKGSVTIGPRPLRPSVVASRLGQAFFVNGETEAARFFWEEAVNINPKGACRARQGLAKLALAEGNPSEAEKWCRDALLVGKFQAKTVSVWPLLVQARQKQEKTGLDRDHLAGLREMNPPSVQSRAVLAICNELRRFSDPTWRELADDYQGLILRTDAILGLELAKLLLADAIANEDARSCRRLATHIFFSEVAQRGDLCGAAKAYLKARLQQSDRRPPMRRWVERAERRFGPRVAAQVQHAMGLAAAEAGHPKLAIRTIGPLTYALPPTRKQWGQSTWALAGLYSEIEFHEKAAELYLTYADQPAISQRFRVLALNKWIDSLKASGEPVPIEAVEARLNSILDGIEDVDVLLDVARHLVMAGREFFELHKATAAKAEEKALVRFREAEHPSQALYYLVRLTRRQMYDYGRTKGTLEVWNSLSEEKRLWLWSTSELHWEYMSMVLEAHLRYFHWDEATELLQTWETDPSTPSVGLLHCRIMQARWTAKYGKPPAQVEEFYRWAVDNHPKHILTAWAYDYFLQNKSHYEEGLLRKNLKIIVASYKQVWVQELGEKWL